MKKKKIYKAPGMVVVEMCEGEMLCTSGDLSAKDNLVYEGEGGMDEDVSPNSISPSSVWNEW